MIKKHPNTVRITGGTMRGRKIQTPGGYTHPMGERERIALFNMISDRIPGALVMDAYSGSGALGIEALSRGAKEVIFIDKWSDAIKTIRHNCIELGIPNEQTNFYLGSISAFCKDYLSRQENESEPIDDLSLSSFLGNVAVVIADPSYDDFKPEEIAQLADVCLSEGGIMVLSHPGEAVNLSGLLLLKSRAYAAAHVSIYAKN